MSFAKDVLDGLSADSKFLSSKYFYDEKGDKLFQRIMELDEYYLTSCEYEILENNKRYLLDKFQNFDSSFHLVEFGAGDGLKTKVLINHFLYAGALFQYVPIDISEHAVSNLIADLKKTHPNLDSRQFHGDYFDGLESLNGQMQKKVVLFLGSNIGNFRTQAAIDFLEKIRENMGKDDLVLIGFDLKKDPDVIRSAYNDSKGVTRDFNFNLLIRINKELGGRFDIDNFLHKPEYDPETGAATSYLVSKTDQKVSIDVLQKEFSFVAGEKIFMEVSQKYDHEEISELARMSGFKIITNLHDERKYFVDSLWQPV